MNSIEKRKATILRKRENKLIRQQIYKTKQELKKYLNSTNKNFKYDMISYKISYCIVDWS